MSPPLCPRCKKRPRASYHKAYCSLCSAQATKEWQEKNPERDKIAQRFRNLRRKGMTEEKRTALLKEQGGGCAVCGFVPSEGQRELVIDHDHSCCSGPRSCGKCVRGLLCNPCNLGVRIFELGLQSNMERYLSSSRLRKIQNLLRKHSDSGMVSP